MPAIKMRLNVPVVGIVKYCDWYAAKEKDGKTVGPDVGLKGAWEGTEGESTLYVPGKVFQQFAALGLVTFKGDASAPVDPRWVHKGRVRIEKAEGEGRAHVWTVTPLDGSPAPAPAAAAAPSSSSAPAPAAPANGAPLSPEEMAEAAIERARAYWVGQRSLMQYCIALSIAEHKKVAESVGDGSADGLLEAGAILTTAHSHYIQANRDGMFAPPRSPQVSNGGAHD